MSNVVGRPGWNAGLTLPPEPLTREEVLAILRQPSRRAPSGVRNRALLVLIYRTGLRIDEALSLYPKDVDLERSTVSVLRGKGAKHRIVGLDAGATAELQLWLNRRKRIGLNGRQFLFCSITEPGAGGKLRADYARAMLRRYARRAGVEKRVHPHGLRHTHAVELVEEGISVGVIQKQLGHAKLEQTVRYLDHVAPQQVIEAMRQREWTRR